MLNISAFRAKAQRKKPILVKFLKKFDKKFVPNLLKQQIVFDKEVWAEINCLECANCCKTMTPTYTPADLTRISTHLGLTKKQLYETYLMKDDDNKDTVNKNTPCQWLNLKTNKCKIYEVRPLDCATFPHHTKKDFDRYNHVYEQNLDKCPATLKMIEKMQVWINENYVW